VTGQSFTPRYLVELTSDGPLAIPPTATRAAESGGITSPRMPTRQRTQRASGSGPTYVYRCPYCSKTFDRRSMDGTLNAHKTPQGYPCPGRTGFYVRTKS
jgi:hypothetical protein